MLRTPKRWTHFRSVPMNRLWVLMAAVFLLFSVIGFYVDLTSRGTLPYAVVLLIAAVSGLNAALWIIVLARLPVIALVGLAVLQFFTGTFDRWASDRLAQAFHVLEVPSEKGIAFASTGIMVVVIVSYVFFIAYIRREGRESFRLRNELELAHGMQKTLVPPIALKTRRFEMYGVSRPSEKVGGDLVDALALSNGDAIAYLGDIAGHGLSAGILMGMLKTATRTALLDAAVTESGSTLPQLFERLNRVLPAVKEPHMYATFTAFRLNADGSVFYAMAASPPILHWQGERRALDRLEEEQYPLGLLPVSGFTGDTLQTAPGDLLVVATDGILEVCDRHGREFGVDSLEEAIAGHVARPLPELAEAILAQAGAFGKQIDDQTLLLIRCLH
ncbi:serine/threonine-protein phosphatase [Acidipila sp. 4G-K13]|nr:serine/threonine-protein phosphatase [Paracidobacterium acidisoli]